MLNDSVRALLDAPIPAVLATVNPDGSPQTSVVWVGRDGDDLLVRGRDEAGPAGPASSHCCGLRHLVPRSGRPVRGRLPSGCGRPTA
ncbi:pyridoxamine 5'-phosphate oxidase family protein [Streptomyces sp. NPDC001292]|uniref:pyridoxamine 5'-phosphate oxidase family protein n=1 Tax=Streptomyces sp. NPDC001292 TaxID=3364558 RepID=UPI0036D0A1EC